MCKNMFTKIHTMKWATMAPDPPNSWTFKYFTPDILILVCWLFGEHDWALWLVLLYWFDESERFEPAEHKRTDAVESSSFRKVACSQFNVCKSIIVT